MFSPIVFFNRDGETAQCAKRMMSEVSNDMKVFQELITSFWKSASTVKNLILYPHIPSKIAPNEKGVPYTYDILEEILIEHKAKIDKCGAQIRKKYWFTERMFGRSWHFGPWYEKYHDDYKSLIMKWEWTDDNFSYYFGTQTDKELAEQASNIRGRLCFQTGFFPLHYSCEEEFLSKDPKIRNFYRGIGVGKSTDALLIFSLNILPVYWIASLAQTFVPCIPDTEQTEDVESSISLKPLFF